MIGGGFAEVLLDARGGGEQSFVLLWRDANPAVARYLSVVSDLDAADLACSSWVTSLRALPRFEGDEVAWRALVFGAARVHAGDEERRQAWREFADRESSRPDLAALEATGGLGSAPQGEHRSPGGGRQAPRPEPGGAEPERGLRLTLEAVGELPRHEAEVLMLRLAGGLPVEVVAEMLGLEPSAVARAERQGLQALGADAELVAWSLDAPAQPHELADEPAVVLVYRAVVRPREQSRAGSRSEGGAAGAHRSARVISLRTRWTGMAGAAAAASVLVVGAGGLSAAAYTGSLPDAVQNVMHEVIGAPAAEPDRAPERSGREDAGTPGDVPAGAPGTPAVTGPPASSLSPASLPTRTTSATSAQPARTTQPTQTARPTPTAKASKTRTVLVPPSETTQTATRTAPAPGGKQRTTATSEPAPAGSEPAPEPGGSKGKGSRSTPQTTDTTTDTSTTDTTDAAEQPAAPDGSPPGSGRSR